MSQTKKWGPRPMLEKWKLDYETKITQIQREQSRKPRSPSRPAGERPNQEMSKQELLPKTGVAALSVLEANITRERFLYILSSQINNDWGKWYRGEERFWENARLSGVSVPLWDRK